jgi:putative glycerol-1-phosphate prenyltransferase
MSILNLIKTSSHKQLALLIDPDKYDKSRLIKQIEAANIAKLDFFFLGGSLITNNGMDACLQLIKQNSSIPIVLFPGNGTHIHTQADAILFLSLISGRNADLLIGNHVHVAPMIKRLQLEAIPTAYMLIESGKITTAQYMSNTFPIPSDKADVAVATAIAGEMLGLQAIYLDAGSGAINSVSTEMIAQVKANISIPLFVGGGIRTAAAAKAIALAGADLIVVGNAAENNPNIIIEITNQIHSL